MSLKMGKGPAEVMRALFSGDPEQVKEALDFQREAFRAQFGCYPEQCEVIDNPDNLDAEQLMAQHRARQAGS